MSENGAFDIYGYTLRRTQLTVLEDAMALANRSDFAAAIDRVMSILLVQPEFAPAYLQAANFMLKSGHYRDARKAALLASETTPRSPEFALLLIRLLRIFEEVEQISALVKDFNWEHCINGSILVQVAGELAPIALYQQSLEMLDRADAVVPDDPQAQYLRGTIALMAGDENGAQYWLRKALDVSGLSIPHVHWMLTMKPHQKWMERDITDLRTHLQLEPPGTLSEAYLSFGLHNLLHASARYEESWEALDRGCRAKRRLQPYDLSRQRALFDALLQTGSGNQVRQCAVQQGTQAVFIVGMHRSGTSVLERILAGHRDVADGGESYVFPAAMREVTDHFCSGVLDETIIARASTVDLALAGERFRAYARWRADGRRCFTEKLPSNFMNLGFILRSMPDACVVHMQRDPMDTCFSNLRTYFNNAALYSYDQHDLADYFLMYRRLMQHWRALYPGRILDVGYEALVSDTQGQARRVMEFCGLEFQEEALDLSRSGGYSATASTADVRLGMLKNRGRAWEPYKHRLGTLMKGLRPAYANGASDAPGQGG